MNNKLTTPKAILIGSFMIAGTILYTSGNISNPIIGTAHADSGIQSDFMRHTEERMRHMLRLMKRTNDRLVKIDESINDTNYIVLSHTNDLLGMILKNQK